MPTPPVAPIQATTPAQTTTRKAPGQSLTGPKTTSRPRSTLSRTHGKIFIPVTTSVTLVNAPRPPCPVKHTALPAPTTKVSVLPRATGKKSDHRQKLAPSNLKRNWTSDLDPIPADATKHSALLHYNKKYRGINSTKSEPMNGETLRLLNGFSPLLYPI